MTTSDTSLNSQRVFKKSSPNGKLTMYLSSRDLLVEGGRIDRLQGVLQVDAAQLQDKKLFAQVTLTFRYGREDEEVMGLKFCNEAVMSLAQVWPPPPPAPCGHQPEPNTPLQEALLKRLGGSAHALHLELTPLAPPSVQLVPAKQYHGAPIGTSYDVRAYIAERADEKVSRRNTVRMGIRVLQGSAAGRAPPSAAPPAPLPPSPHLLGSLAPHSVLHRLSPKIKTKLDVDENTRKSNSGIECSEPAPPRAAVDKPFLLSDGRVELEAWLDKALYSHGESVHVSVAVVNNSQKTVRRIKAMVVQHVDVCMFSNGKFKNVVALVRGSGVPVAPGQELRDTYTLTPHRGVTKNWIALEDSYSKTGACLASTVLSNSNSPDERNVFAIYVSYYVKVKLTVSAMGGELSVKLPFTLTHSCINEPNTDVTVEETTPKMILEGRETSIDEEDESKEVYLKKYYDEPDKGVEDESLQDNEEEHCRGVTDVLVNIENKIEGKARDPLERKATEVCIIKADDQELDQIVKYPGTDT